RRRTSPRAVMRAVADTGDSTLSCSPHLMTTRRLRVGVLGAGAWDPFAPPPGFLRDSRCELVAIADPQFDLARAAATQFEIPIAASDHRAVIERDDIDVIDVS